MPDEAPKKDENTKDITLDPITEISKRLDEMKVEIDKKNAELDKANKQMAEMMDVNKQLYARINGQPTKPTDQAPTPPSYDELMIKSAVGYMQRTIERSG